jgi:hypothetical protein
MQRASLVDSVVITPNNAGIRINTVKIRSILLDEKPLNFSNANGATNQMGPSSAYK